MKRTAWGGLLAALALAVCLSLLPTTARAADHSHAVCGSVDGTNCPDADNHGGHGDNDVVFQEMRYIAATGTEEAKLVYGEDSCTKSSGFGYKIRSGKYYLSSNITLDALIYIDAAEDVTICLNGHSITVDADGQAIAIAGGSELTLCDCQGSGTITHGTDPDNNKKYIGCGVLVNGGGTFTMYGGSITGNQVEGSGAGVSVYSGGSFAMYGGSVTGNTVSSGNTGAGIYTSSGATIGGNAEISGNEATNGKGAGIYCSGGDLRIQGNAKITGNKASGGEGAGIYCGGSLSIQGKAEISGNEASGGKGGGVYVNSSYKEQTIGGQAKITNNTAADGGVYMTGWQNTLALRDSAAITGNTAIATETYKVGGISMDSYSTLKVSGSVQVTGNVRKESEDGKDSKASNVYVGSGSIAVAGELTADALIGVTVSEPDLSGVMSGSTKAVATADQTGWIQNVNFSHDGGDGGGLYGIRLSADGKQAELRHDHVWEFSKVLPGSQTQCTLNVTCKTCRADGGSVTLTAPEPREGQTEMTYDGGSWKPTVTGADTLQAPVEYLCTYRCNWIENGTTTPSLSDGDKSWCNAGHYTITVTGGEVTDYIEYDVQPRTATPADFDFTPPAPETLVYDGQAKIASVNWKDGVEGGTIEAINYQKSNGSYAPVGGPVKAGQYWAKIYVGESQNIRPPVDGGAFGDEAWTFTIQPAEYDYEMPATAELVEGSDKDRLPKGTGTGVALPDGGRETVEGTLKWFLDEAHSKTLEQANLDEAYKMDKSLTLYWVFTATNTNYTTTPKSGSVVFTIVEPYSQDLRIMLVGSNENKTELVKNYEERVFYLNVTNASPGGGDITYFESDDEVARVEKFGAGSYKVTIKGAGTTTIKVTAAEVPLQYKATTATCTLKVLPREVIFGAQVKDKIYDGTRDAKVNLTLNNVLDGDEVYVIAADATFATQDVGENKMVYIDNVRLGGANARGYVVNYGASQQRPLASISARAFQLADVERVDKEYDGNADYTVRGEAFEGLLPGVTLTRGVDYDIAGYFPDADADETDQTVNVFVTYIKNENTKNYCLSIPNGKYTFPSFARITKAPAPQVMKTGAMTIYNQKKETYTFDVMGLLPTLESSKTYGTISGTVTAVTLNDGYYNKEVNGVKIENGKLLLPIESVSSSTTGKIGTVTVTVTTSNYEDIILTIDVNAANQPSSGGGGGGGSTTTNTETTTNPDGSVTKTETKSDGTVIETTTNTDGSTSKTESKTTTKSDGSTVETVTETNTNADGSKSTSKTETTTNKDGSKTETKSEIRTEPDGTKSETKSEMKTDANGVTNGKETTKTTASNGSTGTTTTTTENGNTKTEAEAKVSEKAVEDAKKSGEAVKVPTEVKAGEDSNSAPTVKVELPKNAGETKIEIPVEDANSGTVAVIVHPDGTEEIVKDSKPTEDGVQLTVDGSTTIKIIDNSKNFRDTRDHWSRDEVNFVASREIFNGVGGNNFGVNQPMTRGMVNTVLARLAGIDTTPKNGQKWYEVGNEWAKANGISDGTNPEASVTREQLATLLYRFSGTPEVRGNLLFSDAHEISDYAENALIWATQNGIMNGVGNNCIAPSSDAQRAQVAAMMARYLKNSG